MPKLHIVLCEPQIPQNTGNISRTCAVTGAVLHLIKPYGFEITDKNLKRAGLDYWDKLEILEYADLSAFLESHADERIYYFTTKARSCHSDVTYPTDRDVYLMFGREDAGLPEELAERLTGDTEEEIRKDAEKLAGFAAKGAGTPHFQPEHPEKDTKQEALLDMLRNLKH